MRVSHFAAALIIGALTVPAAAQGVYGDPAECAAYLDGLLPEIEKMKSAQATWYPAAGRPEIKGTTKAEIAAQDLFDAADELEPALARLIGRAEIFALALEECARSN